MWIKCCSLIGRWAETWNVWLDDSLAGFIRHHERCHHRSLRAMLIANPMLKANTKVRLSALWNSLCCPNSTPKVCAWVCANAACVLKQGCPNPLVWGPQTETEGSKSHFDWLSWPKSITQAILYHFQVNLRRCYLVFFCYKRLLIWNLNDLSSPHFVRSFQWGTKKTEYFYLYLCISRKALWTILLVVIIVFQHPFFSSLPSWKNLFKLAWWIVSNIIFFCVCCGPLKNA